MPTSTDVHRTHRKNINGKALRETLKRFQRRCTEDRLRDPEATLEKNLRESACLGAAGLVGRQGKNRTPQTSLQTPFLEKQDVSTNRAVSPERDPATEAARITRDNHVGAAHQKARKVVHQKELANW